MYWEQLQQGVEVALKESFERILEGAQEDIKLYAEGIAKDLLRAIREGDSDLTGELKDQLIALAEIQRIRVVNEQWTLLEEVVAVVMRLLLQVVKGGQ